MTTDSYCDVVIVGAGPAGSVTALALQKYAPHLKVIVVDKASFPRDKTCGDGLGPGVRHALRELDALDVVKDAYPITHFHLTGPSNAGGEVAAPPLHGESLSILPRKVLDANLVQLALDRGVVVWQNSRFKEFLPPYSGDYRHLALRCGEEDSGYRYVRARIVVGADGAYSQVRRAAGAKKPSPRFKIIVMRSYVPLVQQSHTMRIDFGSVLPAYGSLFPISQHEANMYVGMFCQDLREGKLRQYLADYGQLLEQQGIIHNAPRQVRSHHIPSTAIESVARDRVVLIGDAASVTNPFSGEGISYAMNSAVMLGKILAELHESPAHDNAVLASYKRAVTSRYRRHLYSSLINARIIRSRGVSERLFRHVVKHESAIHEAMLQIFAEQSFSPWRLTRAALTRRMPVMVATFKRR